jgi:hypothetical protein
VFSFSYQFSLVFWVPLLTDGQVDAQTHQVIGGLTALVRIGRLLSVAALLVGRRGRGSTGAAIYAAVIQVLGQHHARVDSLFLATRC